ncbi:FRUITFULL 2 MADS-box transcription factor [Heracleum sosnowskyi]|uniref:FRUITFULL 2 MADS-box transcription factor n=1 Tax=Heracleum sosnowskyi TaxID=360622 RepID=A0AAD8MWN5_9APIA|nr:FRUITFULL 2 MADS-box transcription factor [Heracleum sosnowskyi]
MNGKVEDWVAQNIIVFHAFPKLDSKPKQVKVCLVQSNIDNVRLKTALSANTPKSHLTTFIQDATCNALICKLCEYATDSCMERILERYERYSYAERQLVATDIETQGSWNLEHAKLQARIEVLQKNERHYMGEDLDSLSLKELHNLEHQLDSALKHIRSRKSQLMFESISQLQRKDKTLQEHNNLLVKQAKDKEKEIEQTAPVEQQNDENSSIALPHQLALVNVGLAQFEREVTKLTCSEKLSILAPAGEAGVDGEVEETAQQQQASTTTMPAWMLSHINR